MKSLFRYVTALLLAVCMVIPAHALDVPQALELLELYYIDDLPDAVYQAQGLDELSALVGDPYTAYLSPEAYARFLETVNGSRLVGIGVSIQMKGDGALIVDVLDDSPALEAGLAPGDTILMAEGAEIKSLEQARALLGGEEGSTVLLGVRKRNGTRIMLELERREVVIRSTLSYRASDDGSAGVILCSSFGQSTPEELAELIGAYDGQVNAWIVDLSSNPGGTSQSGVACAGCFVGGGIMLYFRDGSDNYSYSFVPFGTPARTEKPAILLASPDTASSAELFMAALRDYGGGISLGQRTYGKGVAQVVLDKSMFPDLFDGDALKITALRFFSPAGVTNDQVGVLPTLVTALDKTYGAALLLCGEEPAEPAGHLRLDLSGWVFYIDLDAALNRYRAEFVELLEALPPGAMLRKADGAGWYLTTPEDAAAELGLTEYRKRTFTDLEGCDQAAAIVSLRTYGLLSGYGDGTFHPQADVTRAEFCAMLGNVLGYDLEPVARSAFDDVDAGAWYAPVVQTMCELGLLSGYGDGTFRPDAPISQEEVVSILAAVAAQLNMNAYSAHGLLPGQEELDARFSQFSSWARGSAWLLDLMEVDLSVPSGSSVQAAITRARAAGLIYQMLGAAGLLWQ